MAGSSDSNLNPGESDPFLHLHKMSTTAGLGSGDYVAINGTSIACILLGLSSALVLFDNIIFLFLPVLGLVAGVLAWQQISRSNGTQTGREVAVIGLLLSLGFGGFYSVKKVYGTFQNRSDEDQVVSQVHRLGELVNKADYKAAYGLFDDDFKNKFPMPDFENRWKQINASPYLGPVKSIDWNHLLTFEVNPVDNSRQATGMMLMYAKSAEPLRIHLSFKNVDGVWLIDQLPELFQQQETKKPAAMGPPKPR
jgi:hypothetical protein